MESLFTFVWKHQGLFWLCGAVVAGLGWRRFRKVSWGIFTFVLLLKCVSWELNTCASVFQTGKGMAFTHGLFAEEAWRDPEHNLWKMQALAITDGLIPLLFIPGLIARWIEEKRIPNQASHATSEPAPNAVSSSREGWRSTQRYR